MPEARSYRVRADCCMERAMGIEAIMSTESFKISSTNQLLAEALFLAGKAFLRHRRPTLSALALADSDGRKRRRSTYPLFVKGRLDPRALKSQSL